MQFDITTIASKDVQDFIFENEAIDDAALLAVKHKMRIPFSDLSTQLFGRRKAKFKLPSYYHQRGIIYPKSINLEQSSSEETASYKAAVLSRFFHEANLVTDLTGGFGVDSLFFSQKFARVIYVEPDQVLLEIARHNHQVLGGSNICHHNSTAEKYLQSETKKSDLFYIDPSRRSQGTKTIRFQDGTPNVVDLLPVMLKEAQGVLIKSSPLLDLSVAIHELSTVFRVIVVAVDNDCKEVLYLCRQHVTGEPEIECIDLKAQIPFVFTVSKEREASVVLSRPLEYIYEPNVAILKAGAFKSIAQRFGLKKLDTNTHLYTSNEILTDFPGRVFRTNAILKNRREIKVALPDLQANLILRNFPGTTHELKSSLGIQDGGDKYVLATTSQNLKVFILADRVK